MVENIKDEFSEKDEIKNNFNSKVIALEAEEAVKNNDYIDVEKAAISKVAPVANNMKEDAIVIDAPEF